MGNFQSGVFNVSSVVPQGSTWPTTVYTFYKYLSKLCQLLAIFRWLKAFQTIQNSNDCQLLHLVLMPYHTGVV